MTETSHTAFADFIVPLYINGLHGRMLKLPSPPKKKREILLLYGLHANIERMEGLALHLNEFGGVTLPDLPGFGGMETFYKIGRKPDIEAMADYLAAVVKLRYKKSRFTIVAMSYGFVVATRMLQKYPEIAGRVDLLVSVVGFTSKEDFHMSRPFYLGTRAMTAVFGSAPMAWLFRHVIVSAPLLRLWYKIGGGRDSHPKFKDMSDTEYRRMIKFETVLWHCNDVRTYMATIKEMFRLSLPKSHVDLTVYHVASSEDRYFNNLTVEQHMRTIFKDFVLATSPLMNHAPTILADPEEAAAFIPPRIRYLLRKQP